MALWRLLNCHYTVQISTGGAPCDRNMRQVASAPRDLISLSHSLTFVQLDGPRLSGKCEVLSSRAIWLECCSGGDERVGQALYLRYLFSDD